MTKRNRIILGAFALGQALQLGVCFVIGPLHLNFSFVWCVSMGLLFTALVALAMIVAVWEDKEKKGR